MRQILEKVLSLIFALILYSWIATSVHEEFHYLMANWLGIKGYVTFTSMGGHFFYEPGQTISRGADILVGLAGGLGTAAVFTVLWVLAKTQTRYTFWELDDLLGLQIVIVTQLIYSPFDAISRTYAQWGAGLGFLIGTASALLMYGKSILEWLQDDE